MILTPEPSLWSSSIPLPQPLEGWNCRRAPSCCLDFSVIEGEVLTPSSETGIMGRDPLHISSLVPTSPKSGHCGAACSSSLVSWKRRASRALSQDRFRQAAEPGRQKAHSCCSAPGALLWSCWLCGFLTSERKVEKACCVVLLYSFVYGNKVSSDCPALWELPVGC